MANVTMLVNLPYILGKSQEFTQLDVSAIKESFPLKIMDSQGSVAVRSLEDFAAPLHLVTAIRLEGSSQ